VAQYLILEDYLTPYLLHYMMDEATCRSPKTCEEIELLYVAGYQYLAKPLSILACNLVLFCNLQINRYKTTDLVEAFHNYS